MKKNVPIGEAVRFGWAGIQRRFALLIAVMISVTVIETFFSLITDIAEGKNGLLELVSGFAAFAITGLLTMGLITITLKIVDEREPVFMDLFANLEVLAYYVASAFLYCMMVVLGFFLLVIPGIYVGVRFQFFGYFIVDEKRGPLEALQQSAKLTRGRVLELFVFDLLLFGLNILGALLLGVGLLITMPMSWLALSFVFRNLHGAHEAVPAAGALAAPEAPSA